MEAINLYSGSATAGAKTAVFVPNLQKDSLNRNNTGHVQMVVTSGVETPAVKIEGSSDGTNWIDVATGVNTTTGFHIAVFPYIRANVTTAGTSTNIAVYLIL